MSDVEVAHWSFRRLAKGRPRTLNVSIDKVAGLEYSAHRRLQLYL